MLLNKRIKIIIKIIYKLKKRKKQNCHKRNKRKTPKKIKSFKNNNLSMTNKYIY